MESKARTDEKVHSDARCGLPYDVVVLVNKLKVIMGSSWYQMQGPILSNMRWKL